jgi:hypothetical protein
MRVSENRVVRKIFGSKMEKVAGGRSELLYEELYDFHSLLNINDTEKQI